MVTLRAAEGREPAPESEMETDAGQKEDLECLCVRVCGREHAFALLTRIVVKVLINFCRNAFCRMRTGVVCGRRGFSDDGSDVCIGRCEVC